MRNVLDSAPRLIDDLKATMKESGEGGAGSVWTDEQKAKMSASIMGMRQKPVTRCEILQDGKTHQKVRLTRYESAMPRKELTRELFTASISACCLNRKDHKSAGGYLWWFCKEDDVYDEEITVEWVGDLPRDDIERQ